MKYTPIVYRFFCLIGLVVASASLADDLFEAHDYCSFGGGCEEVAASNYSHLFGIPIAAIGLVGFALVLTLSLFPDCFQGRLLLPLSLLAATAGLMLFSIQLFAIGRICQLCVVADSCGIAIGTIAIFGRVGHGPKPSLPWRTAWLIAAGTLAGVPLFWSWMGTLEQPVPEQVKAYWIDGKVTIVEVSDFDCPACQRTEVIMKEILRDEKDIHLVRLVSPMPSHANAVCSGKAFFAAARQGKGEEMATALFAAEDRSPATCRKIAENLKLDMEKFQRDVDSDEVELQLFSTDKWAKKVGRGVPLIWVQGQMIHGVPRVDTLREAIEQGRAKKR